MADATSLKVALYGVPIGTLTLLPGDQSLFAFDQAYIDNLDRPTLSLSFKDQFGGLITDVRPTRSRVPPFFSNLLPEGALREYLARKAGINPQREFFLLQALGLDLPGALTLMPEDAGNGPAEHNSEDSDKQVMAETMLRFSLAGVQLKLSAVMEATGGLTIPVEGVGGSWIVKLPSMKFAGVPENEFAMMELARRVGIDVPEVRLVPLTEIRGLPADIARLEGQALAVKRFDRTEAGAVHIEDFAQVFGVFPEKKFERASYRNIADVLWAETGEAGITEFIRRLVFNALIGNADMHLKNWSLMYPDRKTAVLAPGYDFVATIAYLPDENMALTLGRSKAMSALSLDQFRYLAAKSRLPEKRVVDTVKATVIKFMDVWQGGNGAQAADPKIVTSINALLARIPLVEEV